MKFLTTTTIIPIFIFSLFSFSPNKLYALEYSIPIIEEDHLTNSHFLKEKLNIIIDREDLARRGEITFFSSFSYLWAYQLVFFDIFLSAQFNDQKQSGKLSGTNFVYSLLTTLLIALMVTRKDTKFIQILNYKEPSGQFITQPSYYREQTHEWRFMMNLFSYDF